MSRLPFSETMYPSILRTESTFPNPPDRGTRTPVLVGAAGRGRVVRQHFRVAVPFRENRTLSSRALSGFVHFYADLQDVVSPSMLRDVVAGVRGHPGAKSMRDPVCGRRGTSLLRGWVNKGVAVLNPSPPISVSPHARSSPRPHRPPSGPRTLWRPPFGDPSRRELSSRGALRSSGRTVWFLRPVLSLPWLGEDAYGPFVDHRYLLPSNIVRHHGL